MGVATPKDLTAYSQGINVNVFTIAKYVRHTRLEVGRTESSGKERGPCDLSAHRLKVS